MLWFNYLCSFLKKSAKYIITHSIHFVAFYLAVFLIYIFFCDFELLINFIFIFIFIFMHSNHKQNEYKLFT